MDFFGEFVGFFGEGRDIFYDLVWDDIVFVFDKFFKFGDIKVSFGVFGFFDFVVVSFDDGSVVVVVGIVLGEEVGGVFGYVGEGIFSGDFEKVVFEFFGGDGSKRVFRVGGGLERKVVG